MERTENGCSIGTHRCQKGIENAKAVTANHGFFEIVGYSFLALRDAANVVWTATNISAFNPIVARRTHG
jgi:hypothetical protein